MLKRDRRLGADLAVILVQTTVSRWYRSIHPLSHPLRLWVGVPAASIVERPRRQRTNLIWKSTCYPAQISQMSRSSQRPTCQIGERVKLAWLAVCWIHQLSTFDGQLIANLQESGTKAWRELSRAADTCIHKPRSCLPQPVPVIHSDTALRVKNFRRWQISLLPKTRRRATLPRISTRSCPWTSLRLPS